MSEQAAEVSHISRQGEEYLRLLGFDDLIETPVTVGEVTVPAKDFLQFCGQHAIPAFAAFKELDPASPAYEGAREALRNMVLAFVTPPEVNS